jgi:ATP-dependent Clp protease ATP-binding subunit ClpC
VTLEEVRGRVEELRPPSDVGSSGPPFTHEAKKVLEFSLREALQLGYNYIGTEHMLLGIAHQADGLGAQVLTDLGADPSRVRQEVMQLLTTYQGSAVRSTGMYGRPSVPIRRPRQVDSGSASEVGRELTARVVHAGRSPSDYESAYNELVDMIEAVGIAVGDPGVSRVVVCSVDTNGGPSLMLSISQRVEDDPVTEAGAANS